MGEATTGDPFAAARAVADAVLYEGYVLYPYRASSREEPDPLAVRRADAARLCCRRPVGAVRQPAPRWSSRPAGRACCGSRCASCTPSTARAVTSRTGTRRSSGSVGVRRAASRSCRAASGTSRSRSTRSTSDTDGVHRETRQSSGAVRRRGDRAARAVRRAAADAFDVENRTAGRFARPRRRAAQRARRRPHDVCALDPGRFLSMTDPPEWAAPDVAGCQNDGTWPVLGGSDRRSCCPRRSSSTTTRRSRRRARATSTTRPRSTRSSRCAR